MNRRLFEELVLQPTTHKKRLVEWQQAPTSKTIYLTYMREERDAELDIFSISLTKADAIKNLKADIKFFLEGKLSDIYNLVQVKVTVTNPELDRLKKIQSAGVDAMSDDDHDFLL